MDLLVKDGADVILVTTKVFAYTHCVITIEEFPKWIVETYSDKFGDWCACSPIIWEQFDPYMRPILSVLVVVASRIIFYVLHTRPCKEFEMG